MATAALGHAALDNGPLGQHGGETLVEQLNGQLSALGVTLDAETLAKEIAACVS